MIPDDCATYFSSAGARKATLCFLGTGLLFLVLTGTGCALLHKQTRPLIPLVALSETPPAVRATIVSTAQKRSIHRINRVRQLEGPIFYAYIAGKPDLQLLIVDGQGSIIDNAVAVDFTELPEAVQESAKTGVAGRLQACRKSIHRTEPAYIIDYMLGDNEPVYAMIHSNGFIRAVVGYAEDDPD